MARTYAVLNALSVIAVIIWNYYTNVKGINGNTVGDLSDEYNNLFTPASYAFSIWGLIFLALLAHVIFQLKRAFSSGKSSEFILQMGPWFLIANLANCAWVWFWLTEQTGTSVLCMTIILISLLILVVRLNMERWDAPRNIIVLVWWPLCLYSGWIAVAMIANVAAYLAKIEWSAGLSEQSWTIVMLVVAVLVNLFMIATRNMREFALVGVWALVAIAVRHWGVYPALQWTAVAGAAVLFIAAGVHALRPGASGPFGSGS